MYNGSPPQFTLRELFGLLESYMLYGILPVLGHPKILKLIRFSSAQTSKSLQSLDHLSIFLAHHLSIAHQHDHQRARIILDQLEAILVEIEEARLAHHQLKTNSQDNCER